METEDDWTRSGLDGRGMEWKERRKENLGSVYKINEKHVNKIKLNKESYLL